MTFLNNLHQHAEFISPIITIGMRIPKKIIIRTPKANTVNCKKPRKMIFHTSNVRITQITD